MLKLYNTLTRKKEDFEPILKRQAGIYTCGPTVYNYAHIGNLRTYIFEDLLKRVLLYDGFNVKHVMNITDVGHLQGDTDEGEDKVEMSARKEKKSAWDIARAYEEAFKNDLVLLNIQEPDIWCRATEHIKEQIELIKKLEEKGYTYKIENDGIYFDTSKLKDYGKLAKLKKQNLKAGARIAFASGKRNITDFALWKFSPEDSKRQMEWPSPWGIGFPGWHVECSAMSMKYLGETFDIHCGGIDHIPVHHANEIAQSEVATGKPFVNYWLHGNFLVLNKGKMAKSSGAFLKLQSLLEKGYEPLSYRYFCLTAHYRNELVFSWENLDAANAAFKNLKNKIREIKSNLCGSARSSHVQEYKQQFIEAINEDLDIPKALVIFWKALKDNELSNTEKYGLIIDFDKIFGLGLDSIKEEEVIINEELKELIAEREKSRKDKKWKKADEIRDKIKKLGFIVEDSEDGPKLKRFSQDSLI
ncbi:cysteine--tRNA ligase [Candidatus Pacearchaeota archaeon]|nr:cysteine--tRNA ligase [Candidatus Pacearchaeota archaeon]